MEDSSTQAMSSTSMTKTSSEPKCQLCNDTEFLFRKDEKGYEVATPCDCREIRRVERLMKGSAITEDFLKLGFKNFEVEHRPPIIVTAFNTAREYAKNFQQLKESRRNGIALLGRPGSGKTHLLMAVANNLMRKGVKVLYFPFVEGFNNLKDNFDLLEEKTEKMKKVELLFIDDLFKGRENATPFQVEQMYGVINYRYLNHKPILISSERTIDDLCDIDEALGSRIFEMCRDYVVHIEGPRKELNFRLRGLA